MSEIKTVDQYTNLYNKGHYAASFKYIWPYVKGKKVLDMGCGGGVYLEKFSKDSVGIDASVSNLEGLLQKGLHGVRADINSKLPFESESFDVIFCSHVLEHVNALIELLRKSYRVLKRQGIIIIALPVEKSIARFILRDHYFKGHTTHLYSFSLDCLKQLLKKIWFLISQSVCRYFRS